MPVHLTKEEQAEADKLFAKETFNVIASNKVALDRRIRDNRPRAYVRVKCFNYLFIYLFVYLLGCLLSLHVFVYNTCNKYLV